MKELLTTIILVVMVLIQILSDVPIKQWIKRNKEQEMNDYQFEEDERHFREAQAAATVVVWILAAAAIGMIAIIGAGILYLFFA